jgi:dolichol-phosphate mannosyltransferase
VINKLRTLVIIPTYCERGMIAVTLERVRSASPFADILVVDDASPDGTADMVRARQVSDPSVFLLCRESKRGLGPAYVDGFRWAAERRYDIIVEMDADGSHDAQDLHRLISGLETADLVIGSRWVTGGATVGWSRLRKIISRSGNLYARGILGLDVRDATSGYRAFAAAPLMSCLSGDISTQGYAFQVEMVWRFQKAGFRVTEAPIVFYEREAGASKMSMGIIAEAASQILRWRFSSRVQTIESH